MQRRILPREAGPAGQGSQMDANAWSPSSSRATVNRSQLSAACEACKRRKTKCNPDTRPCDACSKRGTECIFDPNADNRRKTAVRKKLDEVEGERRLLDEVLTTMRDGDRSKIQRLVNIVHGSDRGVKEISEAWTDSSANSGVDISEIKMPDADTSLEENVRQQTALMGNVTTEILKDVYRTPIMGADVVDKHMRVLGDWHSKLPEYIHLSFLITENVLEPLTIQAKHSAVMLHVTYLSAIVLLHRRFLAEKITTYLNGSRYLTGSESPTAGYHEQCLLAAHHVIRIFLLLDYKASSFEKCWLCISDIYAACTALAFDAAYKLYTGIAHDVAESLYHVKCCVDMLRQAGREDRIAKKYADVVGDLYQELQRLHRTMCSDRPDFDKRATEVEDELGINLREAGDAALSSPMPTLSREPSQNASEEAAASLSAPIPPAPPPSSTRSPAQSPSPSPPPPAQPHSSTSLDLAKRATELLRNVFGDESQHLEKTLSASGDVSDVLVWRSYEPPLPHPTYSEEAARTLGRWMDPMSCTSSEPGASAPHSAGH